MRYRIKRAAFIAAVNAALAADSNVPKKARTVTVAGNGDGLTITGIGYCETVTLTVPGRGDGFDAVTVEGEALKLATAGAPATITLTGTGEGVAVIRGADDAPTVPVPAVSAETIAAMPARMESAETHGADRFTLAAGTLADLATVASADAARPILTALAFQGSADGPGTVAATDAYRLAVRMIPAGILPAGTTALVPARIIRQALKLAGKRAETLTLAITGDRFTVTGTGPACGFAMTSRLIDGDYPNWHQLGGDAVSAAPYIMDLPTLADAVSAVTAAGYSTVGMMPGADSVTILGTKNGRGESPVPVATVPLVDGPAGMPDGFRVFYNAGFMADALTAATRTAGGVIAWQADPESPELRPGFFGPLDTATGSLTGTGTIPGPGRSLIMPVRLA